MAKKTIQIIQPLKVKAKTDKPRYPLFYNHREEKFDRNAAMFIIERSDPVRFNDVITLSNETCKTRYPAVNGNERSPTTVYQDGYRLARFLNWCEERARNDNGWLLEISRAIFKLNHLQDCRQNATPESRLTVCILQISSISYDQE